MLVSVRVLAEAEIPNVPVVPRNIYHVGPAVVRSSVVFYRGGVSPGTTTIKV